MSNLNRHPVRRGAVGVLAGTLAFSGAALGVGVSPANALEGFNFERLAGENRFETAVEIAEDSFGTADTVILASGAQRNFPDALTGNYLSGELTAPILLTQPNDLPQATIDGFRSLGVQDVVIVGGDNAVSDAVAAEVDRLVGSVTRIGGENRYETARQVAERVAGTTGAGTSTNVGEDAEGRRTAILGNGQNFPDILASGPLSYSEQFPLTITPGGPGATPTPKDRLHPDTREVLEDLNIERVLIVGGTDAVSSGVESEVRTLGAEVTRLDGQTRFETAIDIANFAYDELGFDVSHVNLARSDDFADALTGGPHGGQDRAPIVLTTPAPLNPSTRAFLVARACGLVDGHIFGGTVAIAAQTEADAEAAARDTSNCPQQPGNGEATALSLTPEDETNPVGTNHTVTATLTDAEGDPSVDGELVRFEVFPADGGRVEEAAVVTSNDGTATFTYSDNGTGGQANDDVIVSCVVPNRTTSCTEDTDNDGIDEAIVDPATGDVRNINQDPSDTARKSFAVRVATTVSLTPETATNVLGDPHTVTATVTDQFGDPVDGATVLFERFRDVVEPQTDPATPDSGFAAAETRTATTGTPSTTDAATGQASFTFVDNQESNNLVVVCIDTDADGCAEVVVVQNGPDTVAVDQDDDVNDTATKRYVTAVANIQSLTPETATNPQGEPHTVTATVVDQFGGDIAGQEILFQLFEQDANNDFTPVTSETSTTTVNNQGTADTSDDTTEATFTFTSADAGNFTIVACTDVEGTNGTGDGRCAAVNTNGDLVLDADDETATAQKTFVTLQGDQANEPVGTRTVTGEVINFNPQPTPPNDPQNNRPVTGFVDVFNGTEFLRLFYQADDLFRIEGQPVTELQFEAELAEAEAQNLTITVEYNPSVDAGARSTFNITNDQDA